MRKFTLYLRLLSALLLPVSLICIASLVILKDVLATHWYSITMSLIYLDIGYVCALLMYSRMRQDEKQVPKDKSDVESEIEKASKESLSQSKNSSKQDTKSQQTSETETTDTHTLNVNILDVHTAFLGSEERIKDELKSNSKRATTNLIIGSVIGLVGILILVWFVFDLFTGNMNSGKDQIIRSLETFGARLCIVFLIELFSYFFLKLYKDCIEQTRYYQNELTNIESKKIAILSSVILKDAEHSKAIIESMLCVERNFIIPKDCTTLELEKIRFKSKMELNILDAIGKLGLMLTPKSDKT